jgi:5'-3' exonuclease
MGIKNLQPFIRKTCPHVYRERSLEHYAFKKVAVDVSIYLCKFKTTFGKQWLDALIQFITTLREFDIHPVFIFDTEFPVEKDAEKKSRQLQRTKTREKVEHLTKMWETLKESFQPHQTHLFFSPREYQELQDLYSKVCPGWHVSQPIPIVLMDQNIEKINNSMLSIRSDDYLVTKRLLDILQVPYFQAVGEAEATCSALARYQWVHGVMSEDTDVLAYGAPVFLHRMNFMNKTVMEIQYQELIHGLRMTSSQFLDFCILCGPDYNKNMPKIGPEKSYRLLQKYESLENIERCCQHLDVSVLTYPRVRELFHLELEEKDWKIPFCGFPSMIQLSQFCFEHDCKVDMKVVYQAFFNSPYLLFPKEWSTETKQSVQNFKEEKIEKEEKDEKVEKDKKEEKEHELPNFSISNQPFVNYHSLLRGIIIP